MESVVKYLMVAVSIMGLAVVIYGSTNAWIARQDELSARELVQQARSQYQQVQMMSRQAQEQEQKQKAQFNECMDKVGKGEFKTLDECQKAAAATTPSPTPHG